MESQLYNVIAAGGGVILSLGFRYIPKLTDWYGTLSKEKQGGLMALMTIFWAAALFGLSCYGWLSGFFPNLGLTCDQTGIQQLVIGIFFSLVANQSTYQVIKKH